MAECYPTGCNSCTTPIEFPDSPLDGDRYCVDLGGIDNGQKCWVYDKCIPGWRAEGPNTSPAAVYRGVINIKTQGPGANIEAGHFYIQTETVTAPYYNPNVNPTSEWGSKVDAISTVLLNSRIAFNGQEWEVLPGPEVPYAGDALGDVPLVNGKPNPDDRQGGIVKNATLSQAKVGTDKCDTITPYTLKESLPDLVTNIINDVVDNKVGDGKLEITIDGTKQTFTANQATNEVVDVQIPSAGNGKITFTKNGTEVASFTVNQTADETIDLTSSVPGGTVFAMATFDSDGTVFRSSNVSSVVKRSTGKYEVTFTNAAPDEFYAISVQGGGTAPDGNGDVISGAGEITTTGCLVGTGVVQGGARDLTGLTSIIVVV